MKIFFFRLVDQLFEICLPTSVRFTYAAFLGFAGCQVPRWLFRAPPTSKIEKPSDNTCRLDWIQPWFFTSGS
ncbi:unnamed protein product, partial [Nesidiocoris tenuis]